MFETYTRSLRLCGTNECVGRRCRVTKRGNVDARSPEEERMYSMEEKSHRDTICVQVDVSKTRSETQIFILLNCIKSNINVSRLMCLRRTREIRL